MKILLIGANGQLGTELVKVLKPCHGEDLVALTHRDIEVSDRTGLRKVLEAHHPALIINTSAYHKVDICEDEIEKTFAVNTYGVRYLAEWCAEKDAALLTMSTDYVFGGDKNRRTPYRETDPPQPVNVYGVSKLAGEHLVRYLTKKHFILRVSGLYGVAGSSGKGSNFVQRMIRLAGEGREIRVVSDQVLTPTPAAWVARQIQKLIETEQYGLYHATCQGACSWYEFAVEVLRLAGCEGARISAVTTEETGVRSERPRYSVLENQSLKSQALDVMPHWQEGLRDYLGHTLEEEAHPLRSH